MDKMEMTRFHSRRSSMQMRLRTDKKGNKLFLTYKEIQKGTVGKSCMTNGLLIYG
jgi:hypothetical protein